LPDEVHVLRKPDAGGAARIGLQPWNFDHDLLRVFTLANFQEPRHFVHFRLPPCRRTDTIEFTDYEVFHKDNRIYVAPSTFPEYFAYGVKVSQPVHSIGFQITSFCPLIPRIYSEQSLVGRQICQSKRFG
jgi:hypothetical protein